MLSLFYDAPENKLPPDTIKRHFEHAEPVVDRGRATKLRFTKTVYLVASNSFGLENRYIREGLYPPSTFLPHNMPISSSIQK